MAKWKRELDLKDVWQKAKNKEITLQDLSQQLTSRLSDLKGLDAKQAGGQESACHFDRQQKEFVSRFKDLANKKELGTEEFDAVFGELYDWGDQRLPNDGRVCWIATF